MPRRPPPVLFALGAAEVFLSAGYGVMFTVLDDYRDRYGIPASRLGLIVGVGFFMSFVGQIALGPLADRGFAKRLVLGGLVIGIAGALTMAVGTTFAALLAGRMLMGLGAGMASPAIRRIVILSDPTHLGQNLGLLLSLDVAGFSVGPILSALLVGPFGLAAPFLVIAAGLGACVPFVAATRVREAPVPSPERFAVDLLRLRPVAGAIVMGLALFVMIGTFDALWSIVMDDLGAPQWMASVGITVFALPLIVLGPIGGGLAQRHGPFRVGSFGLVVGAGFMAAYGLLPAAWLLLAFGVVHSLSDGLTVTGTSVAVGMVAPPERQAAAQGLLGGLQTLVAGAAASVAGWSYEQFGRSTAYLMCAATMLALVSAGLALAGPARGIRGGRDGIGRVTPALP